MVMVLYQSNRKVTKQPAMEIGIAIYNKIPFTLEQMILNQYKTNKTRVTSLWGKLQNTN